MRGDVSWLIGSGGIATPAAEITIHFRRCCCLSRTLPRAPSTGQHLLHLLHQTLQGVRQKQTVRLFPPQNINTHTLRDHGWSASVS